MTKHSFKKNPVGYIFVGFLWAIAIYLVVVPSYGTFQTLVNNGVLPKNLVNIAILDLLFLLAGFLSSWGIVQELFTVFTDSVVKRPRLFSKVTIFWEDIIEVRMHGYQLFLKSQKDWMVISLFFYKHPQEVVEFIRTRTKLYF